MQNKIMCVGSNRPSHPLVMGDAAAAARKRNAAYDAAIDLPPSREAVEPRMVPDQEAAPGPYRVLLRSLKEGSKAEVVRLDERSMPRADGYICVFAASAFLAPGAYKLALTTDGAGPDTVQNTFLIQVRFVPAR